MSVTTAGAAPARRRNGGRRQLVAALVISLALNLCFVAGGLWSRFNAPTEQTPAERYQRVAKALGLTAEQRLAFERYTVTLRAQFRKLNQEIDPPMMAAWTELTQNHPDQARVGRLLDEAATQRRAFQTLVAEETAKLLTTFSPEQRAKFIVEIQHRRSAEHQRQLEGGTQGQ